MSENDVIAEYIKNKYPEMLHTADFAFYKIGVVCRETLISVSESIRKIDLSALQDAVAKVNSNNKAAEIIKDKEAQKWLGH